MWLWRNHIHFARGRSLVRIQPGPPRITPGQSDILARKSHNSPSAVKNMGPNGATLAPSALRRKVAGSRRLDGGFCVLTGLTHPADSRICWGTEGLLRASAISATDRISVLLLVFEERTGLVLDDLRQNSSLGFLSSCRVRRDRNSKMLAIVEVRCPSDWRNERGEGAGCQRGGSVVIRGADRMAAAGRWGWRQRQRTHCQGSARLTLTHSRIGQCGSGSAKSVVLQYIRCADCPGLVASPWRRQRMRRSGDEHRGITS